MILSVSTMSTLPPLPPDIAQIAGPMLVGYLLHWGLFGALSVQVYIYYLAFSKDPLHRKVLVYGMYAAESVQTILFSKTAFKQYAAGFGNFQALNEGSVLWFASPILSSVVATVVQIFYAHKIKVLSESNLIAMVVALFALVQLGGGIAQGVIAHEVTLFSDFLVKKTLIAIGISTGSSAVCDVIIAASMIYYLSLRKTTWRSNQQVVGKLTCLIIETGTLTAAVAIINLILSVTPGHPTYFYTTSAVLGKMYSNTLMVVLNSRVVFSRHELVSSDPSAMSSLDISRGPAFAAPPRGNMVMREQWTIPLENYKIHDTKRLEANSHNVHAAPASI